VTDVVVLGAGIAGTAAALTAAKQGARVTVVHAHAGASALGRGAWHGSSRTFAHDDGTDDDVFFVVNALGHGSLGDCTLATHDGGLLDARGRDGSLLDLRTLPADAVVLVPYSPVLAWDGAFLARAWSESARALGRALEFRAVHTSLHLRREERWLSDGAMAMLHDDDERLLWLGERLRESAASVSGASAWLLPPWLGATMSRAGALSSMVGLRCGEATALPGGPAGFRFCGARDRAFAAAGVHCVAERVREIVERASAVHVHCASEREFAADAVIIATGGLVGGGVLYGPSEAEASDGDAPRVVRRAFRSGIQLPDTARVGTVELRFETPGSLFGPAPETLAWPYVDAPLLERVGIVCNGTLVRGTDRVHAAGDVVADGPRGWLDALRSGARAAIAALASVGVPLTAGAPSARGARHTQP
jgi:glycerol-3-phosphate dehydrogenase subunit B